MKYLFFDTETTGTSIKKDRIVSLSWILTDGHEIISYGDHLIIPQKPIPFAATKIHGITTEFATKNGCRFPPVGFLFYFDVIRADVCVAHNVNFDLNMLLREAQLHQMSMLELALIEAKKECSMRLTGKRLKLCIWYANLFGSGGDWHGSLWDSWAMMRAYFMQKFDMDILGMRFPKNMTYNISEFYTLSPAIELEEKILQEPIRDAVWEKCPIADYIVENARITWPNLVLYRQVRGIKHVYRLKNADIPEIKKAVIMFSLMKNVRYFEFEPDVCYVVPLPFRELR